MSKVPPDVDQQEVFVAARRVLLDALDALIKHRDALILVGAQAVHLHSGDADLSVALFTGDADIGIDRNMLGDDPRLQEAMRRAGFELRGVGHRIQPGTWIRSVQVGDRTLNIPVDLLMPSQFSGSASARRRSASIPPHDKRSVRKVEGIELAVVDNEVKLIESFDPGDPRSARMKVAGPAALLVAKAYKIRDRLAEATPGREADKDAGDVIRLMRTTDVSSLSATFARMIGHEDLRIAATARTGLELLSVQFGRPRGQGITMAQSALVGALPAEALESLATAFTHGIQRGITAQDPRHR
jgi:hypothetical protein